MMALRSGHNDPVKLYANKKEHDITESKADLFAIIKATEKLERAYVRDAITADVYETACQKLIAQFKVLWGSMKNEVPDVERFMSEHNMQCPLAATRLLHSGLPATIEHKAAKSQRSTTESEASHVAEAVQYFITAMDSLKLNLAAVDQICPVLLDLINSMDKISSLPPNYGPREKMREWYSKLYQKPATYELTEQESRQMLYELEAAYNTFFAALKGGSA